MTQATLAKEQPVTVRHETLATLTWHYFIKHRLAVLGMCVLGALILGAVFVPIATGYDPGKTRILDKYLPPSLQHPMGTDGLGRDLFLQTMEGGRISLLIGLIATLLSIGIGTTVGSIAGFYGGWIDNALMRVAEIFQLMPTL